MKRQFSKTLKIRKRTFSKESQRAELLIRNKIFLRELSDFRKLVGEDFFYLAKLPFAELHKISNDNILIKLEYPENNITLKADIMRFLESIMSNHNVLPPPIVDDRKFTEDKIGNPLEKDIFYRNIQLEVYKIVWISFCQRWHVNSSWSGRLSDYKKYQLPLVEVDVDDEEINLPIIIRVGIWSTKKEITKIWPHVEELQKMLLKKEIRSPVFARDLSWYDLKYRGGLTPKQISNLWDKNYPEDIDYLVMQKIKRENKELNKEDEFELLNEIKSDTSLADLKEQFEYEREWYISGRAEKGYFNPPFIDVIRKAIKNMEKKIKLLDLPPIEKSEVRSLVIIPGN